MRDKTERINDRNHKQWLKARELAEKLNRDLVRAGQLMGQQQAAIADDVIVISSTDESD